MMKDKDINSRNTGADILRIILVLMILIHHSLVHGIGLSELQNPIGKVEFFSKYVFVLNSISIIGVNGFFWLSGYFGIKRKYSKIAKLYLLCILYSALWNFSFILFEKKYISLSILFEILFPIKDYWFMAVYFFIALLSPYINKLFEKSEFKADIECIILITFFNVLYGFCENMVGIGDGYTAMQGINMYLIGYFCGKHKDKLKLKKRHYGLIYTICSLIIGFGTIILYEIGEYGKAWKLFEYNNPLIIVSAISF